MAANKIRMLESDFIKTNRKPINNNNKNIFKMLNNFKSIHGLHYIFSNLKRYPLSLSKGDQDHDEETEIMTTETADVGLWELDSNSTAEKAAWDQTSPLHVGDSCVA